jgi:GNAT superfamily N-acetyltransferase
VARLEIFPFSDEHLDAAGVLLAARHARQRTAEPLLSDRYEQPAAAREELAAAWAADGASGAAALRDGRLVGYLVGAPRAGGTWGDNLWIEAAGHAVEEAEDVRDLYAGAAGAWVEDGRRRHFAVVPATDPELVDAWFRLGFGQQQAHGVREVPAHVDVRIPDGFEIREPREEDIDVLLGVELAMPAYQREAPVFSELPLPTREDVRGEWESTLASGEETVLVGWRDDVPVACWFTSDAALSSQHRGLAGPDSACCLGFASTVPEARGSGIGVALTDAALAAAAEAGYRTMVVDWRVTNLLASRFWPKRGFRTSFFRLYRSIP